MPLALPITFLGPGEIAEIQQITGLDEQVRRLAEIGLRVGTVVEMIRSGSPCIVRVGGTKLCIREDLSFQVLVAPRMTA